MVTGGAASGKSEYAEATALRLWKMQKTKKLIYLATMHKDAHSETKMRIARHRRLRHGKGFVTVEQEAHIESFAEDLAEPAVILLEDLSNLLTNEMYRERRSYEDILEGVFALGQKSELVIVTNEIFSDGREYDEFTESFIESLAALNRIIAGNRLCASATEVVAGIGVKIK